MAHWKWSQAGCRRGTPWPDVRRRWWWEKGVVAFRSSSCICLQRAAPNDSIGVGVGPTWVGDPGANRRFRVEDAMQDRVPTRISKAAGTTAWSTKVPRPHF